MLLPLLLGGSILSMILGKLFLDLVAGDDSPGTLPGKVTLPADQLIQSGKLKEVLGAVEQHQITPLTAASQTIYKPPKRKLRISKEHKGVSGDPTRTLVTVEVLSQDGTVDRWYEKTMRQGDVWTEPGFFTVRNYIPPGYPYRLLSTEKAKCKTHWLGSIAIKGKVLYSKSHKRYASERECDTSYITSDANKALCIDGCWDDEMGPMVYKGPELGWSWAGQLSPADGGTGTMKTLKGGGARCAWQCIASPLLRNGPGDCDGRCRGKLCSCSCGRNNGQWNHGSCPGQDYRCSRGKA